jgi:hypothetical protein
MRRQLQFLFVALLAAGCGSVARMPDNEVEVPAAAAQRRAQAAAPKYNLAGYPPAVRDGYVDGCESAKKTSLARKDAKRMGTDAQYAMGWNDGYSLCAAKP